jgi:tetratricopeptide (TPR) repeat protein
MPLHDALSAIEDLSEGAGPEAALAALATIDAPAAHVALVRGTLLARTGDLTGALVVLDDALKAEERDVQLEAAVTQASVRAALGDYDRAVPQLRQALSALRVEGPAWLCRDAEQELAAYETLSG